MLAPPSTGLSAQICLDFPKQSPAPPRREGSRDLDEKSASVAKDVPNFSFRAHLESLRRAREARNHADLYRTIWVLFGSAVCGPMRMHEQKQLHHWEAAARRVMKQRK